MYILDDFRSDGELKVADMLELDGTIEIFRVKGKIPDDTADISEWKSLKTEQLADAKISIHRKARTVKIEEMSLEEGADIELIGVMAELIDKFARNHGYSIASKCEVTFQWIIGNDSKTTTRLVFK